MAAILPNPGVVKALTEAGVIPLHCISLELSISVGKPIRIKTEVFATEEQVLAIAEVLQENPEEAREIARSIAFRSRSSDASVTVDL